MTGTSGAPTSPSLSDQNKGTVWPCLLYGGCPSASCPCPSPGACSHSLSPDAEVGKAGGCAEHPSHRGRRLLWAFILSFSSASQKSFREPHPALSRPTVPSERLVQLREGTEMSPPWASQGEISTKVCTRNVARREGDITQSFRLAASWGHHSCWQSHCVPAGWDSQPRLLSLGRLSRVPCSALLGLCPAPEPSTCCLWGSVSPRSCRWAGGSFCEWLHWGGRAWPDTQQLPGGCARGLCQGCYNAVPGGCARGGVPGVL